MNMMAEKTEELQKKEYQLNAIDRCDKCNAQAYVLVKGVSGDLMFCGHHFSQNKVALIKFAYEIVDEREKLIENKLIGEAHA